MLVLRVILGSLAVAAVLGCRHAETEKPEAVSCEGVERVAPGSRTTYRTKGRALVGDVDADGAGDRVALRVDEQRPARCRHLLVVQVSGGATAAATVPPLAWPGTDPQLLLLVDVDGRAGLEPVITLSPTNVYRPGAVFTLRRGALVRMQLERTPPELVPLGDEFPAGVDCAGAPGAIVVTESVIAESGDRHWAVTRTFYRVAGSRFGRVRTEHFKVEVGPEAERRWPEVRGDPFRRCPERVG